MPWRQAAKMAAAAAEAVAKGFSRAVKEELKANQNAAAAHAARTGQSTSQAKESGAANARLGISLEESIQILNVKHPLDPKQVQERYDHLFSVNDKSRGGSHYLQSKVYRAKERIDDELSRAHEANAEKKETS